MLSSISDPILSQNECSRLHFSFFCKIAFTETFYFATAGEVNYQTFTSYVSGRVMRVCSSIKALPKSTSLVKILVTVKSRAVSRSSIYRCVVIFISKASRSFIVNRSYGCDFSDILNNQLAGRKSFEIRVCCAFEWGRKVKGCIILFSTLTDMRTKYADCPATGILDSLCVCLSKEYFISEFPKYFPVLSSDFDGSQHLLWPSLEVWGRTCSFQGQYMPGLSLVWISWLPLSVLRQASPEA